MSSSANCSDFTQMGEKDDSGEQLAGVPAKLGRFWKLESSASSMISKDWKMHQNLSTNQSLMITRASMRTDPINLMLPQSGTAVMFIQMELCSHTLSDYFAERNAEIRPKID
ncbi:hypothetical protein ACH3XW_31320 [Acanthocheilonema viteae]